VDHTVTVGAKQPKILHLCFVAGLQGVNGVGVMAFDEALVVTPMMLLY
jgi:hypothetical protein